MDMGAVFKTVSANVEAETHPHHPHHLHISMHLIVLALLLMLGLFGICMLMPSTAVALPASAERTPAGDASSIAAITTRSPAEPVHQ